MNKTLPHLRLTLRACLTAGVVAFAAGAFGQTATTMPPNLKALPATNVALVANTTSGTSALRFSTTSWNSGTGALQLEAGAVDTGSGKRLVNQRIFLSDGTSILHNSGSFTYHPEHNHVHFDNYALYTLQPVNAPGGSLRTGSKTTFCVMDTTKVNTNLPGAPGTAFYNTCGNVIQGMSVGWGDTYGSHLAGQEIDFTDNADGIYQLKIEVDPKNAIVESTKADNVSCVLLSITKPGTVSVLDSSGACSTVQSITPNMASMGTSVQMTISGFGFTQGMTVTFEGGNGPRPVASNVQLVGAEGSMITATVTVPFKKQLGRNPVWGVRVGTGGILPAAFTVTR